MRRMAFLQNRAQNQCDDGQSALLEKDRRAAGQAAVEGDEDDGAHEQHDGDFARENQRGQEHQHADEPVVNPLVFKQSLHRQAGKFRLVHTKNPCCGVRRRCEGFQVENIEKLERH